VDDGNLAQGGASSYSPQANLSSAFYSPIYESAQYILPITWGAVAGTLIWRGKVRSAWCKQGYDYETFRLVARMRGSPIRVKLLNSAATAKNRLQLANELHVDWKTIDNHLEILTRNGLVEEKAVMGTTRYYVLTEHGRRILLLLADGEGRPTFLKMRGRTGRRADTSSRIKGLVPLLLLLIWTEVPFLDSFMYFYGQSITWPN
jgi:DNA-binding transcriptional ArsR family regulator